MKKKTAYKGAPVEKGATSISGGASPPIRWLVKKGLIKKGMRILDWGAGKSARNADYLRSLGCKVYAYDLHNPTSGNGWQRGSVSARPPKSGEKFDVAFSCYVLNVVRLKDERQIVRELKEYADKVVHVTRSADDLLKMAQSALFGKTTNKWIVDWFHNKYWQAPIPLVGIELFYELEGFCHYGFQTGENKFQRLVKQSAMKHRGYGVVRETKSFTVYADKASRQILPSK